MPLDDDCICLVLEQTCKLQVAALTKVRARTRLVAMGAVSPSEYDLIKCRGHVGPKETTMLPETIEVDDSSAVAEYSSGILARKVSHVLATKRSSADYEFCVVDLFAEEVDTIDDREGDGVLLPGGPTLYPCYGWGSRRRVTYSICLSRAIRASFTLEVVVVPTSWWLEDSEGDWLVIQCYADQHARDVEVPRALRTYGVDTIGWAPSLDHVRV